MLTQSGEHERDIVRMKRAWRASSTREQNQSADRKLSADETLAIRQQAKSGRGRSWARSEGGGLMIAVVLGE